MRFTPGLPVFIRAARSLPADLLPGPERGGEPYEERLADLEEWFACQPIAHKERKLADRQAMIFFRLLSEFTHTFPDFSLENAPVFAAVGPAQTDERRMFEWAGRLGDSGAMPMISPAAAVSLLPNSSFTWTAIRLHLHGESSVWSGFLEAGHAAVWNAVAAVQALGRDVLVMAANCPDNYFVRNTIRRGELALEGPFRECGILLWLSPAPTEGAWTISRLDISSDDETEQGASIADEEGRAGDRVFFLQESSSSSGGAFLAFDRFLCGAVPAAIQHVVTRCPPSSPARIEFRDAEGVFRAVQVTPPGSVQGN